jgi:vanillate O-demethylase monooxygenase subunit
MEDVEVLQAQQKLIETDQRGKPEISVRADLGSVSARRVVQRMIEQEAQAAAGAGHA